MLRRVATLRTCNDGLALTAPAMHRIYTQGGPARPTHPRTATPTTTSLRLVGRDVLAQWPPWSQSDFADVTGCVLPNVWAMPPATPARSNHHQYVAHRGGMLSHTMLLRDTADPTDPTGDLRREVIRRADLCAFMGQTDRFTKADTFYHYDTPERTRVRGRLDRLLEVAGDPTDPSMRVVLTGMGGTGKSHNLAYWVSLQRQAGHMVVYVHDMQSWLKGGDAYLFKEIAFAICGWKHWGATPTMSLDTISEASKNTPWANTKNPTNPKLTLHETLLACVDVIKSCVRTEYSLNPKWVLDDLRALLDALPPVGGTGTFRPKLIFVVDQDNKLNRIFEGMDPNLLNPKQYYINDAIATNTAHLTVASASANNEGWDRRGWPDENKIVQGAHGLSADQADDMMKNLLQKEVFAVWNCQEVYQITGGSPIDIKIICKAATLPEGGGNVVKLAVATWEAAIRAQFDTYWIKLGPNQANFVEALHWRNQTNLYDFQFMEWCGVSLRPDGSYGGSVEFRNPSIRMYIFSVAMKAPNMATCSAATLYERSIHRVLPVLLNSVMRQRHLLYLLVGMLPTVDILQCVIKEHYTTYVLLPCDRAPYIDAISIQCTAHTCYVGLYQITLNSSHADSYQKIHEKRRNDCSYVSDLINTVKEGCGVKKVDIRFFWITDNDLLESNGFTVSKRTLTGTFYTKRSQKSENVKLFGNYMCWNFLFDTDGPAVLAVTRTNPSITTKEYVVHFRPQLSDMPSLMSSATNEPI